MSQSVQPPPKAGAGLRVLTFNTFLGRRLDEVSAVLREVRPHITFLQEVLVYRYRGWTWDQTTSLAREHGMAGEFQRLVWRRGTDIGLAILTTGRILEASPIRGLPERPTGLAARLEVEGETLNAAAVHLSSVPRPVLLGYPLVLRRHRRQVRWAVDHLQQMGGPSIMAGDLNTIPGMPAYRLACKHLNDVAVLAGDTTGTRRTMGVRVRIDYIFASSHFACEDYRVLATEGSDHEPVTATLRWKDSPA